MKRLKHFYQHIDNGGVTFEIQDRGVEGLHLIQTAEYYGYPAFSVSMRIDSLGADWARRISQFFIETATILEDNKNET